MFMQKIVNRTLGFYLVFHILGGNSGVSVPRSGMRMGGVSAGLGWNLRRSSESSLCSLLSKSVFEWWGSKC